MKRLNKIVVVVFLLTITTAFGQITFSGCHPLFDAQTFTVNNLGADVTGRNSFETTPITGDQPCGGVGVCEFRILWNDSSSRWEFLADDGTGDFLTPYLIYYNTEASTPNPPSLILGAWIENTAVTSGLCVDGITTLSGDVQDTTLDVDVVFFQNEVNIYPNPITESFSIGGVNHDINTIELFTITGKIFKLTSETDNQFNISQLQSGLYFVKIEVGDKEVIKKILKL